MGSNKFIIYLNYYLKEMANDDMPELEDFTE